jgi:hypothetical protein
MVHERLVLSRQFDGRGRDLYGFVRMRPSRPSSNGNGGVPPVVIYPQGLATGMSSCFRGFTIKSIGIVLEALVISQRPVRRELYD